MARFVVKLGDIVSDRGVVGGPFWPNVRINNIPLAVGGFKNGNSLVSPHACCGAPGCQIHCAATLTSGTAPNVRVNGIPVVVSFTDLATCGEPVNRQVKPSAVFVTP